MSGDRIQLIDDILDEYRGTIGDGYAGYRNHVYRLVNFCFALGSFDAEQSQKIVIAGCFHDIGIWTADTFDYLSPSVEAANAYLERVGLTAWSVEVGEMIDQHHNLHAISDDGGLVEVFRKGDLVDFSLGVFKCGLPKQFIKDVKKQFPNAGFHSGLARVASGWFFKHPLNPIPVVKW